MRIVKYNKGKEKVAGASTEYNISEQLAQQQSIATTIATNVATNIAANLQEEIEQQAQAVYTKDEVDDAISNISTEVNEISSVTATPTASGNTVTITLTDGTNTTFNVLNGTDGISLGEIGLVQSTGDATDKVMSQKAVSDQVKRITDVTEQDLNGTSSWVKGKLEALGWIFGKKFGSQGALVDDENYCVTPMLQTGNIYQHSVTFCYRYNSSDAKFPFYKSDDSYRTRIGISTNNLKTQDMTGAAFAETTQMRATFNPNDLRNCYILDNTTGVYIFKGDEYLDQICQDGKLLIDYDFAEDNYLNKDNVVTTEDLNGTSDWIKSKLEEKGWAFEYRLYYNSLVADSTKCVSPMLNISVDNQEKLTIYHGTTADYGNITRYNEDNSVANSTYESGTNVMSNYTSNSTTPKLRFTIGIDKIAQSYIYSDTKKKYLFKGDEYLYSVMA